MTTAHVEKFLELADKDPALLAKLGLDKVNGDAAAAAASAAAFITNASKQAKALGLEFSEEEAGKLEKLAATATEWEFEKFAWYATLAADNAATSELVDKDPALLAKPGFDKVNADAAVASAAALITNAVKQAKVLGLEFSEEEARKLEKLAAAATEWEFEKFEELVDSALLAKLGLDKVNAHAAVAAASAAAFITNAVKEAKALGLEFTEEEATKLEKLAAAATEWEFEKFEELVDSALLAKLGLDKVNADAAVAAASAAAFITNAVKEAKALGLQFTEEEAHAFMAAEAKAAASGELSDTQLEAVAGGAQINTSRSNKRPKSNSILAVGSCLVAYQD